jgi:hypothetical protein
MRIVGEGEDEALGERIIGLSTRYRFVRNHVTVEGRCRNDLIMAKAMRVACATHQVPQFDATPLKNSSRLVWQTEWS